MMPLLIKTVLLLLFGVGVLFAVVNFCCMAHVSYLRYVKQDKSNRTVLPPLGSGLMCVALYFMGASHFLLPLLFDYPFPLFLIIPAVKACALAKE